jgi:predicted nucleic acid-binding Zn ribbon protein
MTNLFEHPNVIAARAKGRRTQQLKKQKRIELYNKNPRKCFQCSTAIPYNSTNEKFCNSSCSAKFHNAKRIKKGNCLVCKEELIKKGKNKYCSTKCQMIYQSWGQDAIVEAGEGSAGQVRKYLLRKFGHICQEPTCAWDFEKKPVTVEMDHKDGNAENNSLENCRLLCRNCHSLTPTYGGKNRGKGRFARRERYKQGKSF